MKYIIVIDKQSRSNPSGEAREYVFECDELLRKGDISDDLIIERGKAKHIKRIELTECGVTHVLSREVVTQLGDYVLKLFEGDNYIYVKDEYNNILKAEYVIKNQFTDLYVTDMEMRSAIEQSADHITLSVNKILTGYSTTKETQSLINQTADAITSTVSKTYSTKNELQIAKSEIKQTTDNISSVVAKKVGQDEIISKINQSAEKITIKADKIDIDGKAVHFKTNISEQIGPFTTQDKTKVLEYVVGKRTLTSEELKKYDIDNDGEVNARDALYIDIAINNGGYYLFTGTYEIDPYSKNKSIAIYNDRGYYSAMISLIHNYFKSLQIGTLSTDYNNEKVSSFLGSDGFNITQEDTSNSVYIQVGNWYNNISTTGISLSNGTSDKNSNIDIIAQPNNSFMELTSNHNRTVVSASGITTPILTQTSLKSKKQNIKKAEMNAIELIKNADICLYNLKKEKPKTKKHIGLVIGEGYNCPDEVIEENGQGVEQYSMISLAWKAIQEQQEIIEELKEKLNKQEAKGGI